MNSMQVMQYFKLFLKNPTIDELKSYSRTRRVCIIVAGLFIVTMWITKINNSEHRVEEDIMEYVKVKNDLRQLEEVLKLQKILPDINSITYGISRFKMEFMTSGVSDKTRTLDDMKEFLPKDIVEKLEQR